MAVPCTRYHIPERIHLIYGIMRETRLNREKPLIQEDANASRWAAFGKRCGTTYLEDGGGGHVIDRLLLRFGFPCRHHDPQAVDLVDSEEGELFMGDRVPGGYEGRKL